MSSHLHEGPGREQAIGSCLVACPDSLHLQLLGDLVQATVKVVVKMDHALDVVHHREKHTEKFHELCSALR